MKVPECVFGGAFPMLGFKTEYAKFHFLAEVDAYAMEIAYAKVPNPLKGWMVTAALSKNPVYYFADRVGLKPSQIKKLLDLRVAYFRKNKELFAPLFTVNV